MKKGGKKVTNKKGRKDRGSAKDRTHVRSIEFEL